jgi:hypothetical protein
MSVYRKVKAITSPEFNVGDIQWHDTGGTNGWLADPLPAWVDPFIATLGLGGVVLTRGLRMLPAYQGIPPHIDPKVHQSPLVRETRFQIPLVTHPGVTMRWPDDGVEVHLEQGGVYAVDFTKLHEVVHRAPVDRVHLQVHVANSSVGAL